MQIPIAAFKANAEDGSDAAPAVGDVVDYHVTGKVMAVDKDFITTEDQSANGEPLPSEANPEDQPGEEKSETPDDQAAEEDALKSMSQNAMSGGKPEGMM